ncbi:MAG: YkgJ family cysteine cluster protein [Nitrospira sp.]|nr:YkgJ family cysteine cluster protein [Nitrospira sp.]MDH4304018.1 YkgJ family cysteine cluster protein [Nitrospira sp.]MDH5193764.1 YkgJ family cysteine cluster protein [Nitrospira sp.]
MAQSLTCRTYPLFEHTARWFERANAALLGELPCCRGCAHCCVGIFPVTLLDEQVIQQGLNALSDSQRKRIVEIAAAQVLQLTTEIPQLLGNRYVDQWPERECEQVIEECSTWPCPALESDGGCAIYQFRPLVCRSMGIPPEDEGLVDGACAVQTAVPLIRLSKALRGEENHLAALEAEQLEALRHQQEVEGEEILLPFAFVAEISSQPVSA